TAPPPWGCRVSSRNPARRCRTLAPWPGRRPSRSSGGSSWLLLRYGPALGDLAQRPGVEVVQLVAALSLRVHEAGGFEHVDVLRDCLPARAQPVLADEPRAQLEQGLAV